MNLTIAELAELPLASALLDGDEVIAHTPEWTGMTPGAVSYRVRQTRLVVSRGSSQPTWTTVVGQLLHEIDRTAASLPRRQALRALMLAASLRVVAGADVFTSGRVSDVVEYACAGIAARTALHVVVDDLEDGDDVTAPAVAGLILVQLAANAERHDHAETVRISADGCLYLVDWLGPAAAGSRASTSRRRAERARWGLGFARIAADAIGGVVSPPTESSAGHRSASLELGLTRLALPLALVTDGAVRKATRAWDEETGLLPGARVAPTGRLVECVVAASAAGGAIATVRGWNARTVGDRTWVAVPPDSAVDRARDVLDGMVHERALWDNVPEPGRSRMVALAAILSSLIGGAVERVPGEAWNRRAPEVARVYGLDMPLPRFTGAGALDPRVALFLAAEFGERLDAEGDELYLRIAPRWRGHPLVRFFAPAGDGSVRLS